MPVEPLPCAPGGGGDPIEVTTCCAPSIASTALCRQDGSTVLAVVRSGCVECGQPATDPVAAGWIDAATGAFTPGPLPADVGPCDAGCVDTVCRQLCDDTDGDGAADAAYSELWCIRADGTAELVLTYQDDPSAPYTPVSPVECTYGCPESETVMLCDDAGPFLRRYQFLSGAATFEDVALDGQTPHVVTGTVRACDAGEPCAAQTTPAATLGLCLADGTPIAVLVTRDCAGTVTQDGWLNLTTGTYSAGDPPAGTMACGNPRSITTAGTFCDVDPGTGDVLGLVLIEYTYGADGAVSAVRLVDATTGATYVPQGEVTTCPAGVAQPERDVMRLCDTAADGTVTPFVRDYVRDESGAIAGHTDYGLDGAPYTPTGAVGVCPTESACQDCTSETLCDVDTMPAATIAGTAASGTLSNGVAWTSTALSALPPSQQGDGAAWWGVALFPNPSVPTNLWTFDQRVNVEFSVMMNWSPGTGATENQVQLPPGAVPVSLPAGYTYNRTTRILRADNTLTGCTLNTPNRAASARFRVTQVTSLALRYLGTRAVNTECRRFGHWLFGALDVSLGGEFVRTVCRDCTGAVTSTTDTLLDGTTPYTPVGLVGVCQPEAVEEAPRRDVELTLLCVRDTASGEIVGQVLAERVYDDQTSDLTVQRLTDLAGAPYVLPAGADLVMCQEPACPVAFSTECVGVVARTEASYDNTSLIGGQPGQCGSVQGPGGMFPCQPTSGGFTITSWIVNGAEVISEAGGRAFNGGTCGPGTASAPGMHLNWAQALTNLDPTGAVWSVKSEPACAFFVGSTGGTQTVYGPMTVQDAAGQQWILGPAQGCDETQYTKVYTQECDGTVSVSWLDAQGTATAAPVGEMVPCGTGCGAGGGVGLDVETLALCDVQTDGTAVPFLRHLTYGSAGQVAVVVDSGLDGFAPYTPTGTVSLCQGDGVDVELVPMCVIDNAAGTVLQRILAQVRYNTATGDRLGVTYVDPDTWGPVALPGGTHLGLCPDEQPEPEPCRNSSTLLVCDLPEDGEPAPTVTDTSPDPYDAGTPGTDPVTGGAAALWSGSVLTIPPDTTAASDGSAQRLRTFAATVQAPRPGCDTGTATVTASVRVERDGPDPGCLGTGLFALLVGGTQLAGRGVTPNNIPVGTVQTLTVTAQVPAADLAAGNVALVGRLETYHLAPSGCPGTGPGGARVGGWIVDEFTASVVYDQAGCAGQVFANAVTDCETGAVESVTYTRPDGTPYTPTGTIGQCEASGGACCPEQPCGDTEITQLCDLTYDPQAPIPTPAGDFALTGNVVAANNGTTLWFAQANQEANGVAALTVGGLLPAVMYEFRFASAWIGAGAPTPAANNAIYLLQILDGATVLATRTRNTSNGSNVFPGGVLSEDLPPVAFIAPASGSVTIRFTDQTTGGPVNDRDLFLMPLELRTATLTVTRTPFLRRFTFDCGGDLTSSQDLALDGTTPYTVAGEIGQCTADGEGSSVTVPPCDANTVVQACRCDDADGDGIADTDYVELLGVDCEGALTSLGTYTPDLSAPYVPVAPIDCAQTGDGAEPAIGVQARRVELAPGASWDAGAFPTLQSVTAVAHGGTGTITTADGTSTLHTGEAATWSVARDADAALAGPLTITAVSGTVTITWTRGVTL